MFPCSPYFLQQKTFFENYKQTDLIYAYIIAQDSYGYMVLVILYTLRGFLVSKITLDRMRCLSNPVFGTTGYIPEL